MIEIKGISDYYTKWTKLSRFKTILHPNSHDRRSHYQKHYRNRTKPLQNQHIRRHTFPKHPTTQTRKHIQHKAILPRMRQQLHYALYDYKIQHPTTNPLRIYNRSQPQRHQHHLQNLYSRSRTRLL